MTSSQCIEKTNKSLLIYAERNGIKTACEVYNVSKTTYYKYLKRFKATGSVAPLVRRKPKMPNETSLTKKKILLKLVKEYPGRGATFYTYQFKKQGISIARSTIYYRLKCFDLHKKYKRLLYLERLNMQNQPLTERTLRKVKKHFNNIKHGSWPGHVVGIDTFYVGNIKGIGKIYQMTAIDHCSRYGWANLFTKSNHNTTVKFIENDLIPKYYCNSVELESVVTDNGSEFINQWVRKMLSQYGIKHHRIPPRTPQCNGYCERFQRTINEELYQHIFRIKTFNTIDEIKNELHDYLFYYNFERPHFGLHPDGAIPMDAFKSKNNYLRQRFNFLKSKLDL